MSRTTSWIAAWAMAALAAPGAYAFDSGSTGVDGAFAPTVNTQLDLPPSGIFNFTTVTIPSGVTVTFRKNVTNTPVVILASGNVTIAGAINLNGTTSTASGAAGNGNLGDDGIPGVGASGGFSGGPGGVVPRGRGGVGLGPGGGGGGQYHTHSNGVSTHFSGGSGGGFGTTGGTSWGGGSGWSPAPTSGGPAYGSAILLPLIGGSGGGGGPAGLDFRGPGGGGGGGGILIASSGTINVTGSILANGGQSGPSAGVNCGQTGGGGSGGGIRIVATTLSGNGAISANGGAVVSASCGGDNGGAGAAGRIRLEAENVTRTAATTPPHTFGAPGPVFIAGLPTLRITSVAGVPAPPEPTGNADITLPATTANPLTVEFATTGVPVGNTVRLTVKPATGAPVSVISPALAGTTENATASVAVTLPSGPSTLEATTTYTIVAALGEDLGLRFAQGERVESIELAASLGGESTVTLITVSGKRYTIPARDLPAMVVG